MKFPIFFKTDHGFGKYEQNGLVIIDYFDQTSHFFTTHDPNYKSYSITVNEFEITQDFINGQTENGYITIGDYECNFNKIHNDCLHLIEINL